MQAARQRTGRHWMEVDPEAPPTTLRDVYVATCLVLVILVFVTLLHQATT